MARYLREGEGGKEENGGMHRPTFGGTGYNKVIFKKNYSYSLSYSASLREKCPVRHSPTEQWYQSRKNVLHKSPTN